MTEKKIKQLADSLLKWYEDENNILKMDFFSQNKIQSGEWKKLSETSDYFEKALRLASEIEETRLVMGGLTGKFNQSFASFILKNVVGYRDRASDEQKNSSPYADMSDEELMDIATSFAKKLLANTKEEHNG